MLIQSRACGEINIEINNLVIFVVGKDQAVTVGGWGLDRYPSTPHIYSRNY